MDEKALAFVRRRAAACFAEAQKKGGRAKDALDSYDSQLSQRFGFYCNLKPREKPVGDDIFKSSLAQQYYARYVQAIGATPTAETMEMVRSHIPVSQCRVSAAWKSRGGLADRVYLLPHGLKGAAVDQEGQAGGGGAGLTPSQKYAAERTGNPEVGASEVIESALMDAARGMGEKRGGGAAPMGP